MYVHKFTEKNKFQVILLYVPTSSLLSLFQIPGNKMTAANLAVIFGPNLLQRERGGDVSPHAMGIEDSTAIISVTLVLIQNYRRLLTVQTCLRHVYFSLLLPAIIFF